MPRRLKGVVELVGLFIARERDLGPIWVVITMVNVGEVQVEEHIAYDRTASFTDPSAAIEADASCSRQPEAGVLRVAPYERVIGVTTRIITERRNI